MIDLLDLATRAAAVGSAALAKEPPADTKAPEATTKKARRQPTAPVPPPAAPFHLAGPDGRVCVSVGLVGLHGAGNRVVLDAIDWERVRRTHGERWTLQDRSGRGNYAVMGMGRHHGVTLARVVAKAGAGETVMARNGCAMDLSRGNLEVVERREGVRRALGR